MQAIKRRLAMGLSPTLVAREMGVSRATVYKARANLTDIAWRSRPRSVALPVPEDVPMCAFGPLGHTSVARTMER